MTNASKTEVWKAQYYPFGFISTERVAGGSTDVRFPGQHHDRSTNLHYNMYRYYRPDVGRYMTPDPIGIAGGLNLYSYAGQNPVMRRDPKGLSTWALPDGQVVWIDGFGGDLGVYRIDLMGVTGFEYATRMGETAYIDEFAAPEGAQGHLAFGESWDCDIAILHREAMNMSLVSIALNSGDDELFDVKTNAALAPYGAYTGKLLNGKYASARSAGNFLAGYNARHGSMYGYHTDFETFSKIAGGLHKQGMWGAGLAAYFSLHPVFKYLDIHYGDYPTYGEVWYTYRRAREGWNFSPANGGSGCGCSEM